MWHQTPLYEEQGGEKKKLDVPYTDFLLNAYYNKSSILQKIEKFPYMGGGARTGHIL